MTYFGFLFQFIVIPILALSIVAYRDRRRGFALPDSLQFMSPRLSVALLALLAVVYTTPWDNYLVATRVWWYDPALVTGITLGRVPLEEYTFFVLQTLLTGLWLLFLARRMRVARLFVAQKRIRVASVAGVGLIWMFSLILLLTGWKPGNYLALELVWALPVIMLQVGFGGDILWHYRRFVVLAIVAATLYYSGMDALAINSGTWTINPERSLGILAGGVLPIEEIIFFALTNMMLVFGLTLGLSKESFYRLAEYRIGNFLIARLSALLMP